MAFVLWIITMFAAALGWVLARFIESLDIINIDNLIPALTWFLVAFMTYYFAKRMDGVSRFGMLSLNFLLTWVFCTIGVILGYVIWILIDQGSVSIQADSLIDILILNLPIALGPTATAAMGIKD